MMGIITHGSVGATYDFALSNRAMLIQWSKREKLVLLSRNRVSRCLFMVWWMKRQLPLQV